MQEKEPPMEHQNDQNNDKSSTDPESVSYTHLTLPTTVIV